MTFRCTGEMCMVHIGETSIDMGNYYVNEETGEKVLVTRRELAEKYSQLVPVRIYVRRPTPHALDGRDSALSQAVSKPEVLSHLRAVSNPALPQVM